MNKKILFLSFILSFSYNLSYAGELISKEAVNYFNEGVKAQKAANFSAAEISYNKTFLVDPYNLDWKKRILNNEGVMYLETGDMEKAEEFFNRALEIDPDYRFPKLNLGLIYEKHRTELESIKYWLKVLNIDLESIKPKNAIIDDLQQTTGEAK